MRNNQGFEAVNISAINLAYKKAHIQFLESRGFKVKYGYSSDYIITTDEERIDYVDMDAINKLGKIRAIYSAFSRNERLEIWVEDLDESRKNLTDRYHKAIGENRSVSAHCTSLINANTHHKLVRAQKDSKIKELELEIELLKASPEERQMIEEVQSK